MIEKINKSNNDLTIHCVRFSIFKCCAADFEIMSERSSVLNLVAKLSAPFIFLSSVQNLT